jgi:two-component system chemotaxis sensor kinase CheA
MDMSQYLEYFLSEAAEHLQALNANLLELEQRPDNRDVFNEILRSAHTLKGMSATMGFKHMSELTHEMESTLLLLKDCQVSVVSEVVDVLFKCLDALQEMITGVEAGGCRAQGAPGAGDFDCLPLKEALKRLQNLRNQSSEPVPIDDYPPIPAKEVSIQLNGYDVNVLGTALDQGYGAYVARFALAPHTLMKAPRVYMVFKAIEDQEAEIVKSEPPAQTLEEENFDDRFDVVFVAKKPVAAFVEALNKISEVSLLSLEQIDQEYLRQKTVRPAHLDRSGQEDKTSLSARTVRVNTERLDSLLDLVGESVINKTRLERLCSSLNNPEIQEAVEHLGRLTAEMQSIVMKMRMVPIEQVFNRFPRMVRDLSRELNKNIQFSIEGVKTELDRTVVDEIGEPLMHLLRNAVDHGAELPEERLKAGKPEQALLRLAARQEGNSVVIEVVDDGRGINLERVWEKAVENGLLVVDAVVDESALMDCVFKAGFSTVDQVTDVSGRGMGMDVVKTKVESLNGSIELDTRMGQGTTARIRLPLTLAIIRAMLVEVGGEQYAIPLGVIDEIALITPDRVKNLEKREAMLLRGSVLPLVRLSELLQVPAAENGEAVFVVVVRKGGQRYGLVADALAGMQDVVIKPLGKLLKGIPGLAGATVLGDGQVSMILAVDSLF